jgi:DNA-nicking Smr family endonuclease
VAIDGELDLHNFSPKDVGSLVREYIEVCHQRGIRDLRIVHGKGKGVLRRTVHSLLAEHALVEHYRLGGLREGSWGATIVRLRD